MTTQENRELAEKLRHWEGRVYVRVPDDAKPGELVELTPVMVRVVAQPVTP